MPNKKSHRNRDPSAPRHGKKPKKPAERDRNNPGTSEPRASENPTSTATQNLDAPGPSAPRDPETAKPSASGVGETPGPSAAATQDGAKKCFECKKIIESPTFVTCSGCGINFHFNCVDTGNLESPSWKCVECLREIFFKNYGDHLDRRECARYQKASFKAAICDINHYINEVREYRVEGTIAMEKLIGNYTNMERLANYHKAKLKNIEEKVSRLVLENAALKEKIDSIESEND